MITNKDIRVENGSLILNGDPYPLDGQSPEAIMQIVKDNSDTTPTENSTKPVKSGGIYSKIGDLTQTGLTGDSVAAQLDTAREQITNKVKMLPTQVTTYNFTAANTYEYTGVSVTCPAGHTYIVRAWLVYNNSEPKGILSSLRSDRINMYDCYAREELATSITFMVVGGESAYIWGKGTSIGSDDVYIDILDIII